MAVSYSFAFIGGIVSFLSPCILPIVPGFLAYLAGSSTSGAVTRRETFLNSLFFVLGFSLVFAVLGILLQTVLVHVAYDARIWLSRAGGVIIIAFGLYLTRLLPIPWLDRGHVMAVDGKSNRNRYITSALFGAAFAAGWTPCVGAVLGAILTLAVVHPATAFTMLLAFSLGLGLPFLVVGLFAAGAQGFINRYAHVMQKISILFGVALIAIGVLVFTQRLDRLANFRFLDAIVVP